MRVFSAYGQGLRKQVFWNIYQKSKKEDTVELNGTGDETRDFIHCQDIMLAIECIIENSKFEADVVNVGSGHASTIKNAAEKFMEVMHIEKQVSFTGKEKEGKPVSLKADISKLKSYGFIPTISIEDGLVRYSNWLQSQ